MDRQDIEHFQIEIEMLEASTDASLWNYGTMRDACSKFSYKFTGGRIYALISDCGAVGWCLSYTLAGRQKQGDGSLVSFSNMEQ
jgi:hypothetical protein